jgi:hypothetical protein
MRQRDIDLVIVFKASSPSNNHISKYKARIDAQHAEAQYTRLLETLRRSGLYVVGRRGEHQGQLILLVSCSNQRLEQLLQHEWQVPFHFSSSSLLPSPLTRHFDSHSDFLYGLTTSASDLHQDPNTLKPAERLRLVHTYVTATPADGGLGINPDNHAWSRVESIMVLHDPEFNDVWIRSVTTLASLAHIGHDQLDIVRTQVCFSAPNTCFPPHNYSSLERLLHSTLLFSLPTLVPSSLSLSLVSYVISFGNHTRSLTPPSYSSGPSSSSNTGESASVYMPSRGDAEAQFGSKSISRLLLRAVPGGNANSRFSLVFPSLPFLRAF